MARKVRESNFEQVILFHRTGENIHGEGFVHDLLYECDGSRWKVWLHSASDDGCDAEDWETVNSSEALLLVLQENMYLELTRAEFDEVLLPNMESVNRDLAKSVSELAQNIREFAGDTL